MPSSAAAPESQTGSADETRFRRAGSSSRLPPIATQSRRARSWSPGRALAARGSALGAQIAEAQRRLREMTAILDTATDGVVILDAEGVIESVNASAEALFGLDAHEMQGRPFGELLTPESRKSALDYLSGLKDSGVASLLNEGREVEAMRRRRLDPALHDHGPHLERGGRPLLRRAARHHALEADRGASCSRRSAPPSTRRARNRNFWRASATRSARR